MPNRSVEELIQELQQLRIRETTVIAEIREGIGATNGTEQENEIEIDDDVNLAVAAHGLRTGRQQSSHQEQNLLTLDGRTVLERKSGVTCYRDKNNIGSSPHHY
jgi:hypothetical protein